MKKTDLDLAMWKPLQWAARPRSLRSRRASVRLDVTLATVSTACTTSLRLCAVSLDGDLNRQANTQPKREQPIAIFDVLVGYANPAGCSRITRLSATATTTPWRARTLKGSRRSIRDGEPFTTRLLKERLSSKVAVDADTARRFSHWPMSCSCIAKIMVDEY